MLKNFVNNLKKTSISSGIVNRMMSTSATNYPNISTKLLEILKPHLPASSPELDPSTNSNYRNFKVNKTTLNLDVSFDKNILSGSISFEIEILNDGVDSIILDSSFLDVKKAIINNSETSFEIKPRIEPLGSPLVINYLSYSTSTKGDKLTLTVEYETTDKCTALQWLTPAQTDDGKLPYLFSQCEPIHARSFFPCFDTPSVKSEYYYNVKSKLKTLMSGLLKDEIKLDDEVTLYKYHQPVPIPSYLCCIASGSLVGKPIGPRSTVFSEPSFVDACQYEFENDTESFIKVAESLVFPYEWKSYDVLILPTAMPFGGMEHPNCTFATPTLISGDRENIDVIAHELAHSWSGNLVTNCSFEHFWLNEGWTVYLERRIIGKLHGEKQRHFSAIIGWTDLENSITSMGASAQRYSTLVQDLKDRSDPDDSFSTVPYEKGFNMLFALENLLGGKKKFDPFVKYYFNKYKYSLLDTYEFLDTLYGFYSNDKDLLDSFDWNTWLYAPGLPPKPKFDTELVDECYSLASKWVDVTVNEPEQLPSKFSAKDIESFGSNQSGVFLDTLVSYQGKHGFDWSKENGSKAISIMSEKYNKYPNSKNAEVIFRWFRLLITGKTESSYTEFADWLGTVGRMKFVRPGYVMLNAVDRELALKTFRKYEDRYHPICKAMVKKDLGL